MTRRSWHVNEVACCNLQAAHVVRSAGQLACSRLGRGHKGRWAGILCPGRTILSLIMIWLGRPAAEISLGCMTAL